MDMSRAQSTGNGMGIVVGFNRAKFKTQVDEYIRELYYRICWGLSQSTNWEIVATSQYKGTTEGFKYC